MKNRRIKKVSGWLKEHWHGILTGLIIASIAIFTLSFQLETLNEGQNKYESATLASIENPETFRDNLINAPYNLPAYGAGQLLDNPLLGARLVSVIYGLLATMLLFFLLKRWFEVRIAAIGSLLFVTSAWVLAISHQAAPFILLVFTPLLLLLLLARYVNAKEKQFGAFLALIAGLAFAAYVPIMVWSIFAVFIALIFVYRKKLVAINNQGILLAALLYFGLLAPLAYTVFLQPTQLKELAGIPEQLPTIAEYLQNFVKQFSSIFVYTERLPELFIYQKPLLDIFSAVMVVLGIYYVYRFMPKRRYISLSIVIGLLLLIIPLQPQYLIAMTALVPFVYIFIPSGIHELSRRWRVVFPRNPFAKFGAAILLVTVIGLSVTYNLEKFYIAWPNTPETNAAYMIESKK